MPYDSKLPTVIWMLNKSRTKKPNPSQKIFESFLGKNGESTICRKMMTERAKGLGRFQKGERVGEQSW